ncbi:peptidase inhibitor family I36 protein [Streptomyces sp. NPDC097704]|uniref:peptidase inhibitor family I36 protein n=1 Tax=Streptomyces sp. NPDC097704 TaxID=3157101 RepID=UPI00332C6FB6
MFGLRRIASIGRPGPASVERSDADYYCVYWDANYAGRKYQFGGNNSSWADWAVFNDDSSSWNNGTSGMGVILYGDEGYSRPLGCLPAGRGWTLHRPNDDGEGNKGTRRSSASCSRVRNGWSPPARAVVAGPYQPLSWHAPGAEDSDDVQGDDVAARRREGYGGPAAMRPERADDPNGDYLRALPPDKAKAYGAALFGAPSHRIEVNLADGVAFMNADGCIAHAEQQLCGDLTRWSRAQMTVVNLAGEVSRRASDDERAARTLPLWRACMKARGFAYKDPGEARAAAFSAYEGVVGVPGGRPEDFDRVRGREISIAVADATCDARVGRTRTLRGLEAQYRRQVMGEHAEQISVYRALRRCADARLASG